MTEEALTKAQQRLLQELADLREKIDEHKIEGPKLYAQQKKLYLKAADAGLTAAQMARAMHPGQKDEDLAESIRQVLRQNGRRPSNRGRTRAKSGPKK